MQSFFENTHAFDTCRIAVIGDLMLDEYLWGHIERISPEAPVPVLSVTRRDSTLGGAGNVVENLRALGVQVAAFGVVGCDGTGEQLRALLSAHGVDARGVVPDSQRRSTRKVRLMSLEHGQQVFRFDEESTTEIRTDIEDELISILRRTLGDVQLILCSDYLKGVLTQRVLSSVFAAARDRGISCIVAPKDANPQKYCGATVLVPNARELAQLVGTRVDGDEWLNDSAMHLIERLGLQALVVTRGGEGMSLFDYGESNLRRLDVATTARSVYDVTGAGDTAVAVFGACVATGLRFETAVRLANLAAGIKVGKRGTACVSAKELLDAVKQDCTYQMQFAGSGSTSSRHRSNRYSAKLGTGCSEQLPEA